MYSRQSKTEGNQINYFPCNWGDLTAHDDVVDFNGNAAFQDSTAQIAKILLTIAQDRINKFR
jgi:hypothetical protein